MKTLLTILGLIATVANLFLAPELVVLVGPTTAAAIAFAGALAVAAGRNLTSVVLGGAKFSIFTLVVAIGGVVAGFTGLVGPDVARYAAALVALAAGFTLSPLDADHDGVPDIFQRK